MDLVSTVRKEGSRGGRGDFQWSDVQTSSHRENYLGHSLMAPVGRWQKGRDLGWYARGSGSSETGGTDGETAEERAARERKEEIKRVKEAEQEAMARALGIDVPPKSNANMQPIGEGREKGEMQKVIEKGVADEAESKGLGYGTFRGGLVGMNDNTNETLAGSEMDRQPRKRYDVEMPAKRENDDHHDRDRRRHRSGRSRSRSRRRHEKHRHRRDHERFDDSNAWRDRRRSRSGDRESRRDRRSSRRTPSRSRSRSRSEGRDYYRRRNYRERDVQRSRSRSKDYPKRRRRSFSPDPRDRKHRPRRDDSDWDKYVNRNANRRRESSRDDRQHGRHH